MVPLSPIIGFELSSKRTINEPKRKPEVIISTFIHLYTLVSAGTGYQRANSNSIHVDQPINDFAQFAYLLVICILYTH